MTTKERQKRRFSEEFRKEQVRMIESGTVTVSELSRRYDVRRKSIYGWIEKYGKAVRVPRVLIQSEADIKKSQAVESENAQLRELVANQQLRIVYKDKLLELALRELGPDFIEKNKHLL